MIYLICSAAIIGNKLENPEFELILKIGYCSEEGRKARFYTYQTENPTAIVLYLIPGGSEQDEKNLHFHFKHLKKPYGNEWFNYSNEILEFFKTHTTRESLQELKTSLSLRKIANRKNEVFEWMRAYSRVIKPSSPEDVIKYEELRDDILSSTSDPSEYLKGILEEDVYNLVVIEKSKSYPETPEYKKFLSLGKFIDRMKFLCNQEILLSPPEYHLLLSMVSGEYENYIRTLGTSEIRSVSYQKSKILDLLKKKVLNSGISDLVKDKIYEEFQVGQKYLRTEIKSILKKIYDDLGYSKSPKATDLEEYFEVSKYQVTNKETGKRDHGVEIGRRLL